MPDVFGASGQFSIDALNNQAQNNINNLYTGGGFGAQTNYYSGLGAQYSAAGMSPYGVFSDTGGPAAQSPISYGGGYNPGNQGGGGYAPSVNDPSINWSQFSSGGLGSGGSQPSIDWSSFTSPSNSYSSFQMPSASQFGGGMFGGLAGGSGYQGPNNAIDWSNLFGGGSSQSLPNVPQQQAPAIDWNNFQSPSNNYNTFQGAGIQAPDPTPQAQAQPPYDFSPAPKLPDAQKLLGYDPSKGFSAGSQQPVDFGSLFGQGVGGSGLAQPQPEGTRTYDLAPMFDSGGGGKFGAGGAGATGTSDVKAGSLGGDAFTFNPSAYRFDPVADKGPESVGASADDMAAQARARLAGLMGGQDAKTLELKADPQDKVTPEAPVAPPAEGEAIPLPVARPAGAPGTDPTTDLYPDTPPPRPPASIPFTVEPGKEAGIRAVQPRLSAAVQGGAQFLPPGYTVEAYSGARNSEGQAWHRGGRAMDVRIIGPDGPIPSEGADSTGMYTLLARGVKTWTQQNDPGLAGQMGWGGAFGTQRGASGGANSVADLMHFDLGGSRGALQPDRQFGNLQPLSAEEQNAMPAYIPLLGANQVPLDAPGAGPSASVPLPAERPAEAPTEQRPGVNQGQDITPPPAAIPDPRVSDGGFNPLDAAANAPVKHTGLELARANIDTPIEQIAMERGGQKAVDQISFMAMGKTPRELAQSYGSMFFSNAEPLFKSLGITRQDFDKAAASPQTKQDIKMRFADMPDDVPAAAQGTPYWNIPKEGTPDWNAQVYEPMAGSMIMRRGPDTIGGASHYDDFRQSGNIDDRRNEQLSRDELASLKARGSNYYAGPEVAPTPLSGALGLGDLPMPGGQTAASARPQGFADNDQGSRDALAKLRGMFGDSTGQTNDYAAQIDEMARGTNMPANTRFNLLSAAIDTNGKILGKVAPYVANQNWPTVDVFANSRLAGGGKAGIQFGSAGEEPVFHPELDENAPSGPSGSPAGGGAGPVMQYSGGAGDNMFQQPASRADLAKTMTFGGGFSPSPEPRQGGVGPQVSLEPDFMRTIAQAESGGDPNQVIGNYKGLYQLSDPEFRKYGGQGSIFDPEQNTQAAGAKMTAEGQRAQDILGRELSPVEQYMVHQQGPGGFLAHVRNPDQPAWQSMRNTVEGQQKGDAWAKSAIWGNLSNNQKAQFGNDVNNITSRDFINLWATKYQEKAVESGQPMTFQGGFSASP